jgi:hypothetical protein
MNKAFWLFLAALFLFLLALEQMLESPPVQSDRSSHKDSSGHPTSEVLKNVQEPVGSPPVAGKSRPTAKLIPPNPESPKGAVPKIAPTEDQDQEVADAGDPDADEEMAEPSAPVEAEDLSDEEDETALLQEDEAEPEDLDEQQPEDVEEEPADIEIEEMTDETVEEELAAQEEQIEEEGSMTEVDENPSEEETEEIVEEEKAE